LAGLSSAEARQVAQWLNEFLAGEWDQQIATDATTGKLDFLFDEAEAERQAGTLRDWPDEKK
jgi:hypothetical protein